MKQHKISVCIPVYNVQQYVGRCLESILNQSLKDIEIIIVNDCTPDKSIDIVRQYASTDSRIKIIENEVNHGQMMSRHTAYMAASGDFITFCDADDTMPDGALESMYNEAIKTNADIVSGVIEYIPIKGNRYRWKNLLKYGSDKMSVFKSILENDFGHNLCSRLFRRELLQNFNYETYDKATNGEDGMLFYQVVDHANKVIAIDNVVYEYWQNIVSSSQVRLSDNALRSIALFNATRIKIVGKYNVLSALLNKKVSCVFWDLKSNGYKIDSFYKNEGLREFCKYSSLIKEQGVIKTMKILLKLLIKAR